MRPQRSRTPPRAQRALVRLLGMETLDFLCGRAPSLPLHLSNKTSPWPLLPLPGFFNILRPVPPGLSNAAPPRCHYNISLRACPVPPYSYHARPSPFARLLFTAPVRPCPSDQAPPSSLYCVVSDLLACGPATSLAATFSTAEHGCHAAAAHAVAHWSREPT